MKKIVESGMEFLYKDDASIFKFDDSDIVKKLGCGFKIVEFVILDENSNINFIEAKSKGYISSRDVMYYDENIHKLVEKFYNSFSIYLSLLLGRKIDESHEIGKNLLFKSLKGTSIKFIVVINKGSIEICEEIFTSLQKELRTILSIYDLSLIVINDEYAREFKMIA